MFKVQLLVLFLIFYVQKSSCDLDSRFLVYAAIRAIQSIQRIDTSQSSGARIPELLEEDDLRGVNGNSEPEMMILRQEIQQYEDLVNWDELCNAQWRISPTLRSHYRNYMGWNDLKWNRPTNPQERDQLISSSECLDKIMDAFRKTIYGALSELTNKAVIENKGCIGITAVHSIHHLYLWAVNFEIEAAVKRAVARADRSSVNNVAQPSTPDYSLELENQYKNYTKILISSFDSMLPRFSFECNNETTSYFEVGKAIELTGFLKKTIFKYDNNECGSIWWSCNSISDPTYADRCKKTWITKAAIRPYDYSDCRYLEAIDTCLTENEEKYRYVDSTKLGFKGREKNCSNPGDVHIEVSSSSSFRTCYCDSINNVWKVHVGMIESDIKNNYIIVGVRFQVVGNTLALQVAEGKLRSLGYVTDFRWIPLKNVKSNRVQLTEKNARFFMEPFFLGVSSTILTGIQLASTSERYPNGFELRIYGHTFGSESGILSSSRTQGYAMGECSDEIEFTLERPTSNFIPESATKKSSCGYIKLEQSSLDHDFGQSTLPLFHSMARLGAMYPIDQINIYWQGSGDDSGFIILDNDVHPIFHTFGAYTSMLKRSMEM